MRGITELTGATNIIINIFASITRRDDIARGMIAAKREIPGLVPLLATLLFISRSGTLTYELADALSKRGFGQRLVLGIGSDPVQSTNFTESLQYCQADLRPRCRSFSATRSAIR